VHQLLGHQAQREVLRARRRTTAAMAAQIRLLGRHLGGRPPTATDWSTPARTRPSSMPAEPRGGSSRGRRRASPRRPTDHVSVV
jgi:hypothetical protein